MQSNDLVGIPAEARERGKAEAEKSLDLWSFQKALAREESGDALEDVVENSHHLYATYAAVMDTMLDSEVFGETHDASVKRALNYFALNIGVSESMIALDGKVFDSNDANSSIQLGRCGFGDKPPQEYMISAHVLIQNHRDYVVRSSPIRSSHRSFLGSLRKVVEKEAQHPRLALHMRKLQQMSLAIEDRVYRGMALSRIQTSVPKASQHKRIRLVGNEQEMTKAAGMLRTVGCYNTTERKNILLEGSKPLGIFLWGQPGTGKSAAINNLIAEFQEICGYKELPSNVVKLDFSFKGSYHSQDAHNLAAKLRQVQDPGKIGLCIADDVDMVFQSRTAKDANHIETQSVGILLDTLQGIGNNYLGNCIYVFATNKKDAVDPALFERCTYSMEVKGPQNARHYSLIIAQGLEPIRRHVDITREEMIALGTMCEEYGLSGRDTNAICQSANVTILDTSRITEELYNLSTAQQASIMSEFYGVVTFDILKGEIEHRHQERTLGLNSLQTYWGKDVGK